MKKYVGIDVAKRTLQVATDTGDLEFQVTNDATGWAQLIQRLKACQEPIGRIVLEATGGYEQDILDTLAPLWDTVRLAPQRARAFAKAMGTTAKTDPIDARMLARMAAIIKDHPTPLTTAARQRLQCLSRRRDQLVQMRDDDRRRLHQSRDTFVTMSIKRQIRQLQTDITRMDKAISEQLKRDPSDNAKRLQTVKGFGAVGTTALIAFVPELGQVDSRTIAALVGLAPYDNSSGEKEHKRSIRGGRFHVRRALYMPTWSVVQHQSDFHERYQRLIERGKLPKVAITACMRVLLIRLNAMIRDQTEWIDHPI